MTGRQASQTGRQVSNYEAKKAERLPRRQVRTTRIRWEGSAEKLMLTNRYSYMRCPWTGRHADRQKKSTGLTGTFESIERNRQVLKETSTPEELPGTVKLNMERQLH